MWPTELNENNWNWKLKLIEINESPIISLLYEIQVIRSEFGARKTWPTACVVGRQLWITFFQGPLGRDKYWFLYMGERSKNEIRKRSPMTWDLLEGIDGGSGMTGSKLLVV